MTKRLLAVHGLLLGSVYAFAQCVTPPAPTLVSANPASFCSNTSVNTNLNATSAGNQIAWYTVPTGGTALGISASGVNFPVTLSTTTTYYAEALAGGGSVVNTYTYTGATQTFTVPPGITSVTIETWGAQGNTNALGVVGGLGGYATGTLAVNGGDILYIEVGSGGTTTVNGGYNGGGQAGNVGSPTAFGGGGGGASDVRLNVNSLAGRVIVAAGGGGAAGNRVNGLGRGTGGGGGGGYYGGGGGAGWPYTSVIVPTGGTQSAGGIGGTSDWTSVANNDGYPGIIGVGGRGGDEAVSSQSGSQVASSGGVGGGLTGANGTYAGNFAGQSGAGGSSYIGGVTSGSTTQGLRSGNGEVKITYVDICPSATRTPVTVTVNPIPVLTITANPGTTVCAGSMVTLSGSGAEAYGWSGPTQVYDNTPFLVNLSDAGTYTVIGVDTTTGCSSLDSITLTVLPSPTISITASDLFICLGDTVTLSGSGANSYSWSSGGTGTTETVIPSATTYYSLTGTDSSNGCTTTDSILVTVNPNPSLVIAAASTSCAGDTITMIAAGADTYTWSSGGTTATEIVAPTATTTYTVTGTDNTTGCTGIDSVTIVVNALPSVSASAGNNNICPGTSVTMTAAGAATYSWSSGGTTATEIVSPAVTTTYTVTGIDSLNGCSNTATVTITVLPAPALVLTANTTTVCAGSPAILTATGANSYLWSTSATTSTITVSPVTTSVYTVTGTDSSGCSVMDSVTITVNPLPTVTVSIPVSLICVDDGSFTLTGGSPSGGSWSGNGVSGSTFSPSVAGTGSQMIIYTYTDGNGCTASDTTSIDVAPCVGINGPDADNMFMFYPNPASSFITVKWGTNLPVKRLEVTDLTGRAVMSENISSGNSTELDISALPVGVYNLKVVTASESKVYRVVKN